jgi:hypothetical protein
VAPEPHPELEPLSFLLGVWRGEGSGSCRTIQPFPDGEEVCFRHVGKPFLLYAQRIWAVGVSTTHHLHAYLRRVPE